MCLLVLTLLTNAKESFGQLNKEDSIAIRMSGAIRITDSINTPLPDSIRHTTIKHFKNLGLEPSDYFTTKDLTVDKKNNLGEIREFKIQSRNDFELLDNLDVSEDTRIIAYFESITKIENSWMIEYYRIGALRDMLFDDELESQGFMKIGSYGDEGDDIIVIYNSDFSQISEIHNAE